MECTLYLTDDCNLKCSYCYEGNKKNKSYMNEKTLEKALEFITKNNYPNETIHLVFLGGEPLMNKPMIFKAIYLIHQKHQQLKHLFHYQLTTNGTLLDEQTLYFLDRHKFDLSISIDGDRKTHNLNRAGNVKNDFYPIILSNIKKMLANKICFSVRMTITANNVHLLYHNVHYFNDLGIKKINIGIDELSEWSDENIGILDEQLALLDNYYLNHTINNEHSILNLYDYKISTFVFKRTPLYCSAGSIGHLVINSKGDIYPCGYVTNEETWLLGNVSQSFCKYKFAQTAANFVKKASNCQECEIAFTCSGAKCGFLNYKLTGFLNTHHDKTCKIQKIIFKHNKAVFETLYKIHHPRIMNLLEIAAKENIPLGDTMVQIMNKETIETES